MKLLFLIFFISSTGGWSAQVHAGNRWIGLSSPNRIQETHFDLINTRPKSKKGKNILFVDFTPEFKIFDNKRLGDLSMNLNYGRIFNSSHVVSVGIGIKIFEVVPNIGFGYEYHFPTESFWKPGLNANVFMTVPIFGLGVSAGPFLKMELLPKIDILLKTGVNTIIPINNFNIYLEEVALYVGVQVRWRLP